jgi:predicted metal-dependent phosphoesterase TrpH
MIIDLHVHTNKYSKCSLLPPDEAVKRAKAHGLDGICLVEHNAIWDKEEIKYLCESHKYLVLRGMEVDTGYGHILVFGLDSYSKEMQDIEWLRAIVKQRGGLMVAAHPFRTPVYPQNAYGDWQLNLPFEQGVKRRLFSLVDGIEIFNSRSKPGESLFSLKIAQFLHLKTVAGSDAHKLSEVGASATVFNDTIKDEESFLRVLSDDSCYGVNIGEKQ